MRNLHAEFYEFIMHISAYMNISFLYFFEFFTLEELELGRISYIKDVVLYERTSIKFI
jgi:hypothetical protein